MITSLTENNLISFEEDIAECFNDGQIRAPVHLYHGNESEIISVFKNIKRQDYVFCSWRSHYQCLLKGVPSDVLKRDILNKKSMCLCYPKYNIFSSAIVGGSIPIANGRALAEKRKKSKSHVWCFVGDMTSETGCFHENLKYSITHDLPITWVIEDNFKSVCTDTRETWRLKFLTHENYLKSDKIIYYKYQSKYPHAGAGKRVQF